MAWELPEPDRVDLPADTATLIWERSPRVAVIGDYLLDGWWSGRIDRLTREAPAPVVDITRRDYAPGGAANTAMNLAALGARVVAVGLIGDDQAGRTLRSQLADAAVDITGLISVDDASTTTKYRIVAAEQLMLRIDDRQHEAWPAEAVAALADAVRAASRRVEAEIICDYGSSTLTDPVRTALASRSVRPSLCVVDAHDPRRWRELRPDVITPNAGETSRLLGLALPDDGERVRIVTEQAERILKLSGARAAVVTLDHDGTVLIRPDGAKHQTQARPALEKQASGAGDTFVAALTIASICGFELEIASDLAQLAADIAVQKPGTCICSCAELETALRRAPEVALEPAQLAAELDQHRRAGRRIVFTNGCFDVLHRGHTSYLRQAKELGDVLVVAVNDDASVRRLKGPGRPINPASDRAGVLAALSCVDYVTVFEADTPISLIEQLRPDVYAKGGDYSPQMLAETPVVHAVGGEVVILDYVSAHSTTALVDRIRSTPSTIAGQAGGA